MAEFLTTNATSHHIEKIIRGTKKTLVLVSPYLQLSKTLYERLKDASDKGVSINLIYGKDQLKDDQMKLLYELKGLELFYFENLHAKCYLNESTMVITSMNMYEFSEKNNREMGVLIEKHKDEQVFNDALEETRSIINSSVKIDLSGNHKSSQKYSKNEVKKGYCIRCGMIIDFDPEEPLCDSCYPKWEFFSNYEYEEKYCHGCGNETSTSYRLPQCKNCFKLWRPKKLTM